MKIRYFTIYTLFCSLFLCTSYELPQAIIYFNTHPNLYQADISQYNQLDNTSYISNSFYNEFSHSSAHNDRAQLYKNVYQKAEYLAMCSVMSVPDFQQMFQNRPDELTIFRNYELYAFDNFRTFIRTLPNYNSFILALSNRIKNDKKFRKQLSKIYAFNQNFIHEQAKIIRKAQKISTQKDDILDIRNSHIFKYLIDQYNSKIQTISDNTTKQHLQSRIRAIECTKSQNNKCFNYKSHVPALSFSDQYSDAFNNTFGTALDYQLHKELCNIRNTIHILEVQFPHNNHVNVIAPIIHDCAAQAKKEKQIKKAFELADFCHAITNILSKGIEILSASTSAIGKGAYSGTKQFISIEHWQEMTIEAMQLGLLFINEVGHLTSLDHKFTESILTQDPTPFITAVGNYGSHVHHRNEAIINSAEQTYQKIKAMT